MLQRLIAALLGLLGLAAAALGIASATAWRADDPLVASATADTPTLVTEPGVLEVAGEPVTVTVRADGSPVVLVVGRDTDVSAWIGTDPHQLVTGLSDWHDLALSDGTTPEPTASADATASAEATADAVEPSPSASADAAEAGTAADPTGSDMWVTEVTGDGSASLEWTAPPSGRWSLMAVSLGASDPTLELSWPQEVTTPWLWPGVAAGVLLIAVAVVLAIRIRRSASGADWHDVSTGMIAVVTPQVPGGDPATGGPAPATTGTIPPIDPATGLPLTRRQIREAEAAAIAARRGRRGATGAIPTVTGAIPTVTGAIPTTTGATPTATGATPTATGPIPAAPPADPSPTGPTESGSGTTAVTTPAGKGPVDDVGAATPVDSSHTEDAPAPAETAVDQQPGTPGARSGRRPLFGRRRDPSATEETGTDATATAPDSASSGAASTQVAPPAPSTATPSGSTTPTGGAGSPSSPSAPTSSPDGGARPIGQGGPGATAAPDAAPSGADTGDAAAEPRTDETAPRRGLADRLPWRRSRDQEPAAPATDGPTPAPGASTTPDDDAAPAVPGVDEEDDSLSSTQRADSWRRMWGFPADAEPDQPEADRSTDREEDR